MAKVKEGFILARDRDQGWDLAEFMQMLKAVQLNFDTTSYPVVHSLAYLLEYELKHLGEPR